MADAQDGTPRRRVNKQEYYLELLPLVASRSTCVRRMVAAIITDRDGHVLSTGYNGVPSGIQHCYIYPCAGAKQEAGNTSLCEAVHAEQNAIIQCKDLRNASTMYCSCTPCFVCAKMILNTPIESIYCLERYNDKRALEIMLRRGLGIYLPPNYTERLRSNEL